MQQGASQQVHYSNGASQQVRCSKGRGWHALTAIGGREIWVIGVLVGRCPIVGRPLARDGARDTIGIHSHRVATITRP